MGRRTFHFRNHSIPIFHILRIDCRDTRTWENQSTAINCVEILTELELNQRLVYPFPEITFVEEKKEYSVSKRRDFSHFEWHVFQGEGPFRDHGNEFIK